MKASSESEFILVEQTRRLYAHSFIGSSATVINTFFLGFVLWRDVSSTILIPWMCTLLLLSVIRTKFHFGYTRSAPTPAEARKWRSRFVWTLFFVGVVWGGCAFFVLSEDSFVLRVFSLFVLGGMVAGSASVHTAFLPAFLAYSLPSIIPLIVVFSMIGDRIHTIMAGMVTFYLALMVVTAIRLSTLFRKQLVLEFENSGLITRLQNEIEDRITAEKSLLEIKEKIEGEVKHLETDLKQAQKMELIGRLAGGVAHDLNNILGGVVSYPDLLLEDLPEDNPLYKPLEIIRRSGMKAAEVVQDLLTLARRSVAVKNVLNLNDVITSYLNSKEYELTTAQFTNVTITTELSSELLNTQGSEVHLQKTLMNLLLNAAEAMPEGGEIIIKTLNRYIDVNLSKGENIPEGDYVVLTVSDNGCGMSLQVQEQIYEPFYSSKALGRSGSGLGMAVVWGTVKDHDGYIDIESVEGKGTTFTVYLPTTYDEILQKDTVEGIDAYSGDGERILIVDDIETQRELAEKLLKKLGYTTLTASSGEQAIESLEDVSVDLIVLDMIMEPGMDGLSTFRKIRKRHPAQKTIIASGFSESDRVKEAQSLGAGIYVRKPYTLNTLGKAVRSELKKTK